MVRTLSSLPLLLLLAWGSPRVAARLVRPPRRVHASQGICDDAVNAALPFCDARLDLDARVEDLASRVPLSAVGALMIDNATAFAEKSPPVRLPAYAWWNEALHGVGVSPGVKFQKATPHATSFPQVLSVAASFNRTLFYQLGQAISTEARAFYNAGNSGLTYWAPNINIYRDPRWGRGQETPGEDPLLTSEYAVAFVRAMQGDSKEDEPLTQGNSTFLKISATCKHFSSYSQEVPRHRLDAIVTKQDQADTYFPMFEACVKRGKASGLMCSYNAVNGIPSCADRELLTGLVRDQWKFDGYIMSDCEAVHDVIYGHHFTQSPSQTCATVLNAGMDLNCGQFFKQHLVKALAEGIVKRDVVRGALKRLFRIQMRLGMYEKGKQPYADITPDQVDSTAHRQLASEAASQSMVLLKNEGGLLPLNAESISSLALVGPHFNASIEFLANYAGIPSSISTPLGAISASVKGVTYALGCNISQSGRDLPDFEEAEKVATHADHVVIFVGLDQSQEREEIDRTTLQLPGYQPQLIDRMIKASSKPIILVVVAGGCVDLSSYRYHPRVGAILYAGYPGQAGGQAIADVLLGKTNPSGRLTQTFYSEEFVENTSIYDMHMRPYPPTGNIGRTYRFYRGSPVFEFGHGISYTTFRVAVAAAPSCDSSGVWSAQVTVTVSNTGDRSGEFVALLFAAPPAPAQDAQVAQSSSWPLQKLIAFDRTRLLDPHGGDSQEVFKFQLPAAAFALADEQGQWATQPGDWELRVEDQRVHVAVPDKRACSVKNAGGDDGQDATEFW